MTIFYFKHRVFLMIVNIQKYLSNTYNISLDTLKGNKPIKDKDEYKSYNLSIILCWLLHPTQVYGCKSLIARFHGCKHKNRIFRLIKLYEANKGFKAYVDHALETYYKNNNAT